MISVIFDSNVYRGVLSPEDCSDKFYAAEKINNFKKIHEAIKAGKIDGYLSEVILQVESIPKKDRILFFKENMPSKPKVEEMVMNNRHIMFSLSIGGNSNIFPLSEQLTTYIKKAQLLDFKVIHNSRIGFPQINIPAELFLKIENEAEFHRKNNNKGMLLKIIEEKGAGAAQIKNLALAQVDNGENWYEGIHRVDSKKCEKAFAEWADGDAIATCYGYEINYFCTEDIAKKAGRNSIFSHENREWLFKEFAVKIVTIDELAELVCC